MTAETAAQVLAYVEASGASTLDITGGAPELNASFRDLVRGARRLGVTVIDRCNLTVLFEPGQEDLAQFLAAQEVAIVASLPCYTEELVDRQRGKGVYAKSLDAIRALNALGYGREGSGLTLDLVYNPQGASLPPPQASSRPTTSASSASTASPSIAPHARQHADPALRLDARLQGHVQRLHGAPAQRAPRREPRVGDVPLAGVGGLAGLSLRLRLQPDAGPAAARGGPPRLHLQDALARDLAAIPSSCATTATDAPRDRDRAAAGRW
jgi:hypothetical protein